MILTVTLNAALDVTYVVDALVPHSSHRVTTAFERAGGKGVNVARVLTTLGHPAIVTGFAGGPNGRLISDDLRTAQMHDELVRLKADSRRTVTVVSEADGDATVFNQTGPTVDASEWAGFLTRFIRLVRDARVVVLSGSLPPGLPPDAYGYLIRLADEAGAETILDTSGEALRRALTAGPSVIKPNAAEIAEVTGKPEPADAAAELRALGARAVVMSRGPDGLHGVTPEGSWHAVPPERISGNPTGAGDACVAALAAGLASGETWPTVLREAVALSAAAVPCLVAGDFDAGLYDQFRTTVTVEKTHAPDTY